MILVPMDFKNSSNTELARFCAKEPRNQQAWTAFYTRFDEHIRLMLARECRRKNLNVANLLDDFTQNVYRRLVQKDCKALRDYEARTDGSIYKYLAVIAHSVVCEHWAWIKAKKRDGREVSLDAPVPNLPAEGDFLRLGDIIRSEGPDPDDDLISESERQEVEQLLDKILPAKSKERDKMIFKLYFYEGFSAAQIAEVCGTLLSEKRISNIITDIKKRLVGHLRVGQRPESF